MAELARARPIVQAETLLTYYGFDLSGYTVHRTIQDWLHDYRADWIPAAIVEALYQGRYKAVSVSQILSLWKRRGQPLRHFNHEFETIICRQLPYPPELTSLLLSASQAPSSPKPSSSLDNVIKLPVKAQAVHQIEGSEDTLPTVNAHTDAAMTSFGTTSGEAASFNGLSDNWGQEGIQNCDRTQPHSLTSVGEAEKSHEATNLTQADQQAPEAIPPFQPTPLNRQAELRVLQVSNSSKSGVTPPDSIHQFIPEAGLSNTHAKLKAVAQPNSRDKDQEH